MQGDSECNLANLHKVKKTGARRCTSKLALRSGLPALHTYSTTLLILIRESFCHDIRLHHDVYLYFMSGGTGPFIEGGFGRNI